MTCNDCNTDADKFFADGEGNLLCTNCYCMDDPKTYEAEDPIIFLDVDGVLLDTSQALIKEIKRRFGVRVEEGDICNYNCNWAFGIPKADMLNIWRYVWEITLEPYESAEAFVNTLRTKYNVVALSYRDKGDPRKAANRDFSQLNFHGIFLLQHGGLSKAAVVHSLNGACVVEDNIENAIQIAERSDAQVFLIDRPWNQSLDLSKLYTRVCSYDEILDRLDIL